MLSKSSDNRNRGLRGRKNHVPRFLFAVLVAFLSTVAVFALAACSSSDGDNSSPHVDNGKLRIYYEEPYEVVPKGSFYHEKGFGMFLEVYSSLFSSSEVSGLDSTFLCRARRKIITFGRSRCFPRSMMAMSPAKM